MNIWRRRAGEDRLGHVAPAFQESPDLLVIRGERDRGFLGRGPEEDDLFGCDSLIGEEIGGMGAEDDLPLLLVHQAGHHGRDDPDRGRMEGQLRLFEEQRVGVIEERPEEPEEPQRAIGELRLGLPSRVGPPVRVEALEMRYSSVILLELEFLELGDGRLKSRVDLGQLPLALF